jgi:hypothetical protein
MMIEGSGSGAGSGSYLLMDPDPGGPKTCGSGGSGTLLARVGYGIYLNAVQKIQ